MGTPLSISLERTSSADEDHVDGWEEQEHTHYDYV